MTEQTMGPEEIIFAALKTTDLASSADSYSFEAGCGSIADEIAKDEIGAATRAIIAAIASHGYVIVPREPTHEMTLAWAAKQGTPFQGTVAAHSHARDVYRAMITASLSPNTKGE